MEQETGDDSVTESEVPSVTGDPLLIAAVATPGHVSPSADVQLSSPASGTMMGRIMPLTSGAAPSSTLGVSPTPKLLGTKKLAVKKSSL